LTYTSPSIRRYGICTVRITNNFFISKNWLRHPQRNEQEKKKREENTLYSDVYAFFFHKIKKKIIFLYVYYIESVLFII